MLVEQTIGTDGGAPPIPTVMNTTPSSRVETRIPAGSRRERLTHPLC